MMLMYNKRTIQIFPSFQQRFGRTDFWMLRKTFRPHFHSLVKLDSNAFTKVIHTINDGCFHFTLRPPFPFYLHSHGILASN